MKQVRYGIFETNSSSTHGVTVMNYDDYMALKNGSMVRYNGKNVTFDELKQKLIDKPPHPYKKGFHEFMDENGINELVRKTFCTTGLPNKTFIDEVTTFTTPSGDKVVAYSLTEEY